MLYEKLRLERVETRKLSLHLTYSKSEEVTIELECSPLADHYHSPQHSLLNYLNKRLNYLFFKHKLSQ